MFSTVDVREWGTNNYFLRAERECRQFAQDGELRRIPKEECYLRGLIKNGNQPVAYWEVV